MRIGKYILSSLLFIGISASIFAQPNTDPIIQKPKELEDHQLGSEKSVDKKFTKPRHFFQNLYTHYNYYFNANNLINDIVEKAKTQSKDNYNKLLPFYNYTLDATSKSGDIDSVIAKCTAGILLHDLRNDWVDNLYMLIGRAYMLRKNYDTAAAVFQYVNTAFRPTEKSGLQQVIGSNSTEGGSALSISTNEKRNIIKKVFEKPPSRNESFVWQIRNFTETEQYIDAASLISTLKTDPLFPKRLQPQLAEVEAYNYYKQQQYDSSAKYLAHAIPQAENNTEKGRWYYLIGQMYQISGQNQLAADYFTKSVNTTVDPVMEVYGRLAVLRLKKESDPKAVAQNIEEIVKLAKKERFYFYRDIIYYAAALSELERNGFDNAENYLRKSILYNEGNPQQRSESFLLLGDMAFSQKKYGKAATSYDSVSTNYLDSTTAITLNARKPGCHSIYEAERIIFAQDSLQKIAAMPEGERNAYVKALSKKIRKAQGLKEEEENNTGLAVNQSQIGKGSNDIFTNNSNSSGEWYFNNPITKGNGFTQFKQRWGSRPNADNWRRSAAVQQANKTATLINPTDANGKNILNIPSDATDAKDPKDEKVGAKSTAKEKNIEEIYAPKDVSFDALAANLPVAEEDLKASNTSINNAMFSKAKALQNKLEDYPEAIKIYEELLARLKNEKPTEEAAFNLIYCYEKTGETEKANALKAKLAKDFKDGEFTKKMNTPKVDATKKDPAATAKYNEIYNLFIEGNFEKAVSEKRLADSIYKNNYWTPQLLYIESVYYIKQRQDSTAILRLKDITTNFPSSPLATKAKSLIDVVRRRKEIETHLTNLNVTRLPSDTFRPAPIIPTLPIVQNSPKKDSVSTPQTVVKANTGSPKKDTVAKTVSIPKNPFSFNASDPQMVAILLHRVDPVYMNECRMAFDRYNQQNFVNQHFDLQKVKLSGEYSLVTISEPSLTNASKAIDYITKIKSKANSIVPWLDASKYSFILISQANLDVLKQNLDVPNYLQVLKAALPSL